MSSATNRRTAMSLEKGQFQCLSNRCQKSVLMGIAVFFLLNACEKNPFDPKYEATANGLGLTVEVNQVSNQYGEPIEFTLTIVNLTNFEMNFYNALPEADVIIQDESKVVVWQYSYSTGFLGWVQTTQLKPHQVRSYTVVCEDTLEVGQYTAKGWFVFLPQLKDSTEFEIIP